MINAIPSLTPAVINVSGVGDNTVIPAVPGKAILVWKMLVVVGTATNLTIKDGPSNPKTGPMPLVANGSLAVPFDFAPWFTTGVGNALVLNSSAGGQLSGTVLYTLSPQV